MALRHQRGSEALKIAVRGIRLAPTAYLLLPEDVIQQRVGPAPTPAPTQPLLSALLLQHLTQRWSGAIIPPALQHSPKTLSYSHTCTYSLRSQRSSRRWPHTSACPSIDQSDHTQEPTLPSPHQASDSSHRVRVDCKLQPVSLYEAADGSRCCVVFTHTPARGQWGLRREHAAIL